jgi:hypothetical protein
MVLSAFSQVTFSGGRGQLRLLDAEPVPAGDLYLNGFYSFYAKKILQPNYGTPGTREELVSDHTVNMSATLGISRILECYVHVVPYQDNQQDLWGPVGDTRLGLKAHIPNQGSLVQTGFAGFIHLPTAPVHNVPYEGYSADAYGWGVLGLATLDLKSSGMALPFKFFLNVGYRDMNWKDTYFSADQDQLLVGMGLKFPVRSTLIYLETTGEIFINQGDQISLRQNLLRLSPGVRFIGPKDLVFDIAADIRMGNYKPAGTATSANPYLQEYAEWKIILGMTYRAQIFNSTTPETRIRSQRDNQERLKAEEIRKQREQISKELEELRKKVEQSQEQPPE